MLAELLREYGIALVLCLSLVATLLGSLVTWQAYRGYRRHGSRPMLALTVGFALIAVVPFFFNVFVGAVVARLFPSAAVTVLLPGIKYLLEIAGLSFVLYSLYSRRDPDPERVD